MTRSSSFVLGVLFALTAACTPASPAPPVPASAPQVASTAPVVPAETSAPLPAATPARRRVFDFNGDGLADIVIAPKLPPPVSRGTPLIPRATIEDLRRIRVYYGTPGALPTKPVVLAAPDTKACARGVCCAVLGDALAAGDLNGDGFADLVVAGTTFCPDAPGSVLVYYGGPGGLPSVPSRVLTGPVHAEFASALAVGDLDGDGFADLVVGAPRDGADGARTGAVYVYRGSAAGVVEAPARVAGPAPDAWFGASVAVIGDTDGDGVAEIAVGAGDFANWERPPQGAVYVLTGGVTPRMLPGAWTDDAGARGACFADRVIGSDVNGDGLADLIVGSGLHYDTVYRAPKGVTRPAVTTFLGARGGLSRAPLRHHAFGRARWDRLAAAGDVNGDGFADFVVGRPFREAEGRGYYLGDVQLYLGGPDGPPEAPSQVIVRGDDKRRPRCTNATGTMGFGQWVAGLGDVNGDGFDDVAVVCTGTERTLVFTGQPGGLSEVPSAELETIGLILGGGQG